MIDTLTLSRELTKVGIPSAHADAIATGIQQATDHGDHAARTERERDQLRRERDQVRREHKRLQREQTSDAVGAANVHLGLSAVALIARLHKEVGMPLAKMAALLRERFGLTVTPGGLVQVLHRAARVAAPTYAALCAQIRGSPVVSPDETGWRVGAVRHWLWAFATPETTVYRICHGRGFDEAAEVLGADFDGVLVRDGWAPYRRFTSALHQTCLAHLVRRARTLSADHPRSPWAARVQAVLTDALALRDRREAHAITEHGLAVGPRAPARAPRTTPRHGARPAGRPALRRPSRPRVRCRVRLLVGARGGGHQLACRTRHSPRRRQP